MFGWKRKRDLIEQRFEWKRKRMFERMFGRNLIEQRLETLELVIQALSMEVVLNNYASRKPIVVTLEGKRTVVANESSQFGFLYTQLKNAISQETGKKE